MLTDGQTDGRTDGQTDGQTDICTSRAAFAAENTLFSEYDQTMVYFWKEYIIFWGEGNFRP